MEAGIFAVGDAVIDSRTKVIDTAVPLWSLVESNLYILESYVFDGVILGTVDKDTVFTFADDVVETDILYAAADSVFVTSESCDCNRLCTAPPIGTEATCFDIDIVESYIFNVTAVSYLNWDASVWLWNDTVAYDDVSEVAYALGADFKSSWGWCEGTTADDDVFARAVLAVALWSLKADTIVSAYNVTTEYAYITAMVGVDTVTVGNVDGVKDADIWNEYIVTACRMKCPERSIFDSNILDGDVVWIFDIDNCGTGIEVT